MNWIFLGKMEVDIHLKGDCEEHAICLLNKVDWTHANLDFGLEVDLLKMTETKMAWLSGSV